MFLSIIKRSKSLRWRNAAVCEDLRASRSRGEWQRRKKKKGKEVCNVGKEPLQKR